MSEIAIKHGCRWNIKTTTARQIKANRNAMQLNAQDATQYDLKHQGKPPRHFASLDLNFVWPSSRTKADKLFYCENPIQELTIRALFYLHLNVYLCSP